LDHFQNPEKSFFFFQPDAHIFLKSFLTGNQRDSDINQGEVVVKVLLAQKSYELPIMKRI